MMEFMQMFVVNTKGNMGNSTKNTTNSYFSSIYGLSRGYVPILIMLTL